ncbi:DISARM system helicase DrmA [Virgibacillus kekensis]|uniref:DISARM system helicase DrmA n=1 Tax=Virgibacillus kekensis TaxID=202261 RepID=A0ABV9DGL6_9BACI
MKLFNYLTENKQLKLQDANKINPYWSEKAIKRFVNDYPENFMIKGGQVLLWQKEEPRKKDMQPFVDKRKEVIKEMEKYLIGPFDPDEELGKKNNPMNLYLTGKLVPIGSTKDVINEIEEDIQTKQLAKEEKLDEVISNRHVFRPSSMGFSFKMKRLTEITVDISWGMYVEDSHKRMEKVDSFTFVPGNKEISSEHEPAKILCQMKEQDNIFHVSLFLINAFVREETFPKQDEVMFQTKMKVTVDKELIKSFTSKADQHNYEDELLYGDVPEYAVGHGVGVDWKEIGNNFSIESTWMPFHEMPLVEHRKIKDVTYSMKELATIDASTLKQKLSVIPTSYREWLAKQKKYIDTLEPHLKKVAEQKINDIEIIISRVEEGIRIITKSEDSNELEAFRFANRAMMIQQARTRVALKYRSNNERIEPVYEGEWRLFQITFILMNIAGISDKNHNDRDIVDLIWFPTGGGKTEAYLGVAAFLISYRRLIGDVKDVGSYAGVTVFMRYTLRLLTTQQFQRATALVCAAESIRNGDPHKYGKEPFRIGLWIGASSSPNKFQDAKEKLSEILDGNDVQEGNPMQVTHCPWCGTDLRPEDYEITSSNQYIRCHYSECEFSRGDGIPALTIDEAIYQHVPTILIGTVDKVAQIAWKDDMYELFGLKNQYNIKKGFIFDENNKRGYQKINRLEPPELIIQDEMHLISGPLGSMTGLYEIAVDYLCQYKGKGPKIIASTATIRGAEEQVRKLYGRKVSQFPLPVKDPSDNFVSYQVPVKEKPGRLYIGICAPGVSGKIHTIHIYSALLSIAEKIKDDYIDPYWTILGYFNTVKELSGTTTLFKDEIPVRLKLLNKGEKLKRELTFEEMTSRRKAREIPQLLSKMEQTVDDKGSLSAVLATNMISVGVDINRLGLMVMHNQPKTSSEYIQATSRVGRSYPGIVLTAYNSLRPRDLSHYERFKAYHSAIYRYVEPTSVTSFSRGSINRGLVGVVVGAIRQSFPEISKTNSAGEFNYNDEVQKVKEFLIKRAKRTGDIDLAFLESEFERILLWWDNLSSNNEQVSYRDYKFRRRDLPYLLREFSETNVENGSKPAMQSLRSVEGSIKVKELWEDE